MKGTILGRINYLSKIPEMRWGAYNLLKQMRRWTGELKHLGSGKTNRPKYLTKLQRGENTPSSPFPNYAQSICVLLAAGSERWAASQQHQQFTWDSTPETFRKIKGLNFSLLGEPETNRK